MRDVKRKGTDMRISTEINSTARHVGEERAIELIAKAGFDCWDFSMFQMAPYDYKNRTILMGDHPLQGSDYAAFAKRLRHIGAECGITCNQSHAPFPSNSEQIVPYLLRAIECTAIAGGRICVIHPHNDHTAEQNAELYARLLPFAKECGVKIATENMWNWDREADEALPAACSHHDDFVKHLDAVNDPDFVACLDIGHAEMRGLHTSSREMILALGDRLQALHIHDNDRHRDNHAIPFTMDIDFDDVARALAEIGYAGDLTMEADRYVTAPENLERDLDRLAAAAKRFRETVTGYMR